MDHNDMSNRTKITATWVGCLRCIRFYICEFTDAMWYIGNQKKNHNPFATFDPEEIGYGQIEMKRTKPAEMDPFFHRAFLALRCKATVSTSHRHIAFKSATGTGGPTASWSSMAHGDRLLVSRFYSVDSRDGFLLSNYQCQTQNQVMNHQISKFCSTR